MSEIVQGASTIGIIYALIELIKYIVSKKFGIEKAVTNHIQSKLDEIKQNDTENTTRIVDAITKMHLDIATRVAEINKK